jgi:hypothetical protein
MARTMQTVAQVQDIPNVPPGRDNASLLEQFRSHAAGFGQALASWAALREAARAISDRD